MGISNFNNKRRIVDLGILMIPVVIYLFHTGANGWIILMAFLSSFRFYYTKS